MTQSSIIRILGRADKDQWLDLWSGYQDYYQVSLSDDVTQLTWRRLLDDASYGCFVMQEPDGSLSGMTTFTLHGHTWEISQCCYLVDLFVAHEHRRKGYAKALIDQVIAHAKSNNWNRVYWLTKEDNSQARKLYDQYTPVSEFVRYNVGLGD